MAKRLTFEASVETEFRWPQPGDDPFGLPADVKRHVVFADDDSIRLAMMTDGYFKSADALVSLALKDTVDAKTMVYPILFLYRHALELELKQIISIHGPRVGIDPMWNTHDLNQLWIKFCEILARFGTTDPDDADQSTAGVVAKFGKIDAKSFSHRYPYDTKGKPVPLVYSRIDLETLQCVMKGACSYFAGTDAYLSSLE
jgi:hypothetical protein